MKAVIQRVSRASVEVDGQVIGRIGVGLLVLLGVAREDGEADVHYVVKKLVDLRVFGDAQGKMNLCLGDVGGSLLLISQFTLLGDVHRGRRPGFEQAAPPEQACALYEATVSQLRAQGVPVETGQFAATMQVELVNEGPVTFILDSRHHE